MDYLEELKKRLDAFLDGLPPKVPRSKLDDFITAELTRFVEVACKEIEKECGKEGTHSGSLGYQGFIAGINSYQTGEDIKRDKILSILKGLISNE